MAEKQEGEKMRCRTCLKLIEYYSKSNIRQTLFSRISSPEEVDKFLYSFAKIEEAVCLESHKTICVSCLEKVIDVISFHNQCSWAKELFHLVLNQENATHSTYSPKYTESKLCWNGELLCFVCSESFISLELLKNHIFQNHDTKIISPVVHKENFIFIDVELGNDNSNSIQSSEKNVKRKNTKRQSKSRKESTKRTKIVDKEVTKSLSEKISRFLCSLCGKGFIKEKRFQEHLETHKKDEKEKPTFKCDKCDKVVSSLHCLQVHITTHEKKNGEPRTSTKKSGHLCPICGKTCSSSSNLALHKRRHTGTMTCFCTVCDKGFPRTTDLATHMRKHTGERPYPCNVCGKRFIRSDKLSVHMRIHTGEKPYVCSTCGRSYTQSNDLASHKKKNGCIKTFLTTPKAMKNITSQVEPSGMFSIKIIENVKQEIGQSIKAFEITDNMSIESETDQKVFELMESNISKSIPVLSMPELLTDDLILETNKMDHCDLSPTTFLQM